MASNPKPTVFCANCWHPQHVHTDASRVTRRRGQHIIDFSTHPMFFGKPDFAARAAKFGGPCKCKRSIRFMRGALRESFRFHPFHLWYVSSMSASHFEARMTQATGHKAEYTMHRLKSLFTDPEVEELIQRVWERLKDWSMRHQTYSTIENGISVPGDTILERIKDNVGDDEERIKDYMEQLHHNLLDTASNTVNAAMDVTACNCPGFKPLTQDEAIIIVSERQQRATREVNGVLELV